MKSYINFLFFCSTNGREHWRCSRRDLSQGQPGTHLSKIAKDNFTCNLHFFSTRTAHNKNLST